MPQYPDLELNERPVSQTAWRAQRAAWLLMLLIVVSAMLGAFGGGPLDRGHIRQEGMEVWYSRLQRMTRASSLEVKVTPAQDGLTRLWLDRNYLSRFEITSISPPPESSTSSHERVLYTFRSVAGQPFMATFRLRAEEGTFGRVSGRIGLEGGTPVDFSQFIWP